MYTFVDSNGIRHVAFEVYGDHILSLCSVERDSVYATFSRGCVREEPYSREPVTCLECMDAGDPVEKISEVFQCSIDRFIGQALTSEVKRNMAYDISVVERRLKSIGIKAKITISVDPYTETIEGYITETP